MFVTFLTPQEQASRRKADSETLGRVRRAAEDELPFATEA